MKAKQLFTAAVAVFAFSPLAVLAEGGDEALNRWLEPTRSTRSVEKVRAEARTAVNYGERHPVEVQAASASTRSRAEVKAELATHGVPDVRA